MHRSVRLEGYALVENSYMVLLDMLIFITPSNITVRVDKLFSAKGHLIFIKSFLDYTNF